MKNLKDFLIIVFVFYGCCVDSVFIRFLKEAAAAGLRISMLNALQENVILCDADRGKRRACRLIRSLQSLALVEAK